MKRKNVITVLALSMFASSCSTLQKELGIKKGKNLDKAGSSDTIRDDSIIYSRIPESEIRKSRNRMSGNVGNTKSNYDSYEEGISESTGYSEKGKEASTPKFRESLSNDSLVITKIRELRERNERIAVNGSNAEMSTVRLQSALLASFENWKGTKYSFGGDSRRGIDCSALTRRIYREVFSFELPRVSKDQIKKGRHVSFKELRPGDILFFRPEGKYNHTAVYVGNSLFINASSSKGVILSSTENSYWRKYFRHGVRVEGIRKNV